MDRTSTITAFAAAFMSAPFGPQDNITNRINWAWQQGTLAADARCSHLGHDPVLKREGRHTSRSCSYCGCDLDGE